MVDVGGELAVAVRREAPQLAVAIMEQIRETLPELLPDPEDAEANRASNEATLLAMADMLERGDDPYAATLPGATAAWAIDSARRGRSLPGLMRIYRVGHAYVWNWALTQLRVGESDQDEFADAVERISDWLLAYVDALVILAEEAYASERERWLRSSSALRTETINSILAGEALDVAAASRRLGYELDRTHVALVAWHADAGEDPGRFEAMESTLVEVARTAARGEPLIHPAGVLMIAAWIGIGDGLEPGNLGATGIDPEGGVAVAVGSPGRGIEGFARSHREALAARRIAILGSRPAGTLLRYEEVAFAVTATDDLDGAWWFVHRQLRDLGGSEASMRMLETLRTFFAQGCSHRRAAAHLGVHENTVRYRVRQCEDRLGRAIGPEDFDLHAALVLTGVVPALADDEPPRGAAMQSDA